MTSADAPAVTIVVPTFNELGNVAPLVEQLDRALEGRAFQVLFADDSTDGTTDEILRLASANRRVRVNHSGARRGLAIAVVEALGEVTDDLVLVMDGDLQHPAGVAPRLIECITAGADVAVASRYTSGGHELGLGGPARRAVSWTSTRLAQMALAPARRTSDPLSGFFAFRRAIIAGVALHPVGFKILLEVLVRGRVERVVDVPYTFDRRLRARSKASAREGLNFLWHVLRLRLARS